LGEPAKPHAVQAVVLTAVRRQRERRYPNVLALLEDLDRLDGLDPDDFDLSPEPPTPGAIGGNEGPAVLRVALLVAAGFIAVAALVIFGSVALR
jgi:hypothetical protein